MAGLSGLVPPDRRWMSVQGRASRPCHPNIHTPPGAMAGLSGLAAGPTMDERTRAGKLRVAPLN